MVDGSKTPGFQGSGRRWRLRSTSADVSGQDYGDPMGRRVNDRQQEVLRWVADGCPAGRWPEGDFSYKTSAAALRSRGLVSVRGHARTWTAVLTEAGAHYLEHGNYPPGATRRLLTTPSTHPRALADPAELDLGAGASETLEQARSLMERLQREGRITVEGPEESTRAHYRRVLHACRVHSLAPEGHELLFTGRSAGDIVILLSTGSPAESTDWDRIRTTARKITANTDALRTALETSSILDRISEGLRPRAVELLLELAEHLRGHGLRLGINVKLKTPKVIIQVGTRKRDLTLTEIVDEVPHAPTSAERIALRRAPWTQVPKFDAVLSGRLCIRVERDGYATTPTKRNGYPEYRRNADEWSDEKRKPLERRTSEIARAIKKGVVDDEDARSREEQRRAEAHEAHLRELAAERRKWEEIRGRARETALLELREATFARAFEAWQWAEELRLFAERLDAAASASGSLDERPRLREWLDWARALADEADPITNLDQLDDGLFDAEPSADDLRPHMEGWDPSAPHKDYGAAYRSAEPQTPRMPQPRPWHPGMQGRPTWWRR